MKLIEFSLENYKIFKEKVTLSMEARKNNNTLPIAGTNLLKSTLIYGPNSSGKTSILDAMVTFKLLIENSTESKIKLKNRYHGFIFSEQENKPTFLEMIFLLDKEVFKYNFAYNQNEIISENLYQILLNGSEVIYFTRNERKVKFNSKYFNNGKELFEKTKNEVLFLSVADKWNNALAKKILKGFKKFNIISGCHEEGYAGFTFSLIKNNKKQREIILNNLKSADFNIVDAFVEKSDVPENIRKNLEKTNTEQKIPKTIYSLFFSHKKFNNKNEYIGDERIDIDQESEGTKKYFHLLGPILDTLEDGGVLIIDELDNSLHPFLTQLIIKKFNEENNSNAQLIATTHDISLISDNNNLDKSQIWITEKNTFGSAKLFSLSEFNIRNGIDFSKKYIEGRFGGLPIIS